MSGFDVHELRLQEFPHNVKLALRKLEQTVQGSPTPQTTALQQHIIDEFILSSHDVEQHKGKLSKVLSSAVSDMMVVRILCDYLSSGLEPSSLNAVVMLLFHPNLIEVSASQTGNPYSISKISNPYTRNPYDAQRSMGVAGNENPYLNPQMYNGQSSLLGNFYGMNQTKIVASQDMKSSNPYLRAANLRESKVACRLNTLSSLMSLAVATKNSKVLERLAVWMQEVCCLSGWCMQVSKRLIAEYCTVKSDSTCHKPTSDASPAAVPHPLDYLPSNSPLFTSSLITSWAEIYSKLGTTALTPCSRPPASVVRLIVRWLTSSPSLLLLAPLTTPTTMPSVFEGPSPSPATAIAPLLRWCVEAPFFLRSPSSHQNSLKSEGNGDVKPALVEEDDVFGKRVVEAGGEVEETCLYSELQLCLLRCLQTVPLALPPPLSRQVQSLALPLSRQVQSLALPLSRQVQSLALPLSRQVLSYQHVTTIAEGLTRLLDPEKMELDAPSLTSAPQLSLQVKVEAVNRLAQAVLVAKRCGALYGSPLELSNALRRLPVYNRLVKILLTSELNC
ncbi:Protein of unknown function DUF4507 [Trinorchestia longiramus]|nr:Protein of unknown function DUF4507 [Trinorchestia longiramus]